MNWSMGSENGQFWLLLLCIVVGAVVSGSVYGAYLLWRKQSVDEEPLPHCNLEERLSQIAQASIQPIKKTA
jgi:hypothetical protein